MCLEKLFNDLSKFADFASLTMQPKGCYMVVRASIRYTYGGNQKKTDLISSSKRVGHATFHCNTPRTTHLILLMKIVI